MSLASDTCQSTRIEIDPMTGEVATRDRRPITLPWALLLRREDVDVLELFEAEREQPGA